MSSPSFFYAPAQPVRTIEEFTTGIVNVPMHMQRWLTLIARNSALIEEAEKVFKSYNITYNKELRRTKALFKSSQLVPIGVINEIKQRYAQYEPKGIGYYRYIFFELDDLTESNFNYVRSVFARYKLPVFYHRTMRGWHFFCIKPQTEELYVEIMNILKPLNMACPHVTMRIRPNKWEGEPAIFQIHGIDMPAFHEDTERFAKMILQQTYRHSMQSYGSGKYICDRKYLVVNYKQNGEGGRPDL